MRGQLPRRLSCPCDNYVKSADTTLFEVGHETWQRHGGDSKNVDGRVPTSIDDCRDHGGHEEYPSESESRRRAFHRAIDDLVLIGLRAQADRKDHEERDPPTDEVLGEDGDEADHGRR